MSAIAEHASRGRHFEAAGVRSFTLDEGTGEPVLLMHGVPASSFLYRKVVPQLASRGLRGLAFDLPGLGLAARPERFDYSWSGLGAFAIAAVDALELERFHLVVHDIGGPVGFEIAACMPQRVRSITLLNTPVRVDRFQKPWSMRPFEVRGLGEVWLASTRIRCLFRELMFADGIGDRSHITRDELDAWSELLDREDGGRAFLRIMRSFETTEEKAERYARVVSRDSPYPVQVVWGREDPALTYARYGREAEELTGTKATLLPGKHFFQEEQPGAIAEAIARLAS